MATNKLQIPLYHLNVALFETTNHAENIESIIEHYNAGMNENGKFVPQPLSETTPNGFNLRLYLSKRQRVPKWREFFAPICVGECEMLTATSRELSYIMFLYDENDIFAICGNQGNHVIQEYLNSYFGMDIIARLIEENKRVIKSIDERDLTGSVLGSSRFFRYDYKLADEDSFGKLYKKIQAQLGKDILQEKFGISSEDKRKSVGCIAKSAFQINKAITIETLTHIARKISDLLGEDANFIVNKIKIIPRRGAQNKAIIKGLEDKLVEKIFQGFSAMDRSIDLDICHPDYEKFLTATEYNLFFGYSKSPVFSSDLERLDNIGFVYDAIEVKQEVIGSCQDMGEFLGKIRIRSFDHDGQVLTDGPLVKHLHGEVVKDGNTYFYIDGDWYVIEADFLASLNTECLRIIPDIVDETILSKSWDIDELDTENKYNRSYIGEDGFIVLDKVFTNNIEVCDILKYDDSTSYLIHVKKGFNNSTRDLASQVSVAARLVREAKSSSNYGLIEELYDSLLNKCASSDEYFSQAGSQTTWINKESFVSLFKERKICLCMALIDDVVNERDIGSISAFDSNIAKYSLIQLYRSLRGLNIDFKLIQIRQL